jgi:hypothetical protein
MAALFHVLSKLLQITFTIYATFCKSCIIDHWIIQKAKRSIILHCIINQQHLTPILKSWSLIICSLVLFSFIYQSCTGNSKEKRTEQAARKIVQESKWKVIMSIHNVLRCIHLHYKHHILISGKLKSLANLWPWLC